jgi:glycogen(starch) synthase
MISHKDIDPLFEVSWEVCNKVGGINTVIRSKIPQIVKHYKGNYFLIGPHIPENAQREFEVGVPPEKLQKIFEKLHTEGIICHYGKWLIPEEPKTILIDYKNYAVKKDEIKARLWETYKIDSLGSEYHDFDEPIVWGEAVGRLLEEVHKAYDHRMIAQFHEWLTAGALLYLKRNKVNVATVFTTHATALGRTLAGNNQELYKNLSSIDPEKEAYNWKVHTKHQTERACAQNCDVFTTVSEITGMEAEHFLKRKPDVLVYNGLDISKYPTFEEVSIKHKLYKGKMKSFIEYYFFPYYSFDLDNTLIYFLTGRYEYHNKGIDIFIKALAELNLVLREKNSHKTIVAFICVPRDVVRIKPALVENRAFYIDIQESITDNIEEAKRRIIRFLISKNTITEKDMFSKEFLFEMRKKVFRFLKKGMPPLSTHDLPFEDKDQIIRAFREEGLLNREEDKVKVVFYPQYLTGADNLLDLDYDEAIMGAHLGVFPSYYEPWGYTPPETGAMGVAAVTTDNAGFGRYLVSSESSQKKDPGIFVIKTFNKTEDEKIQNLFEVLHKYSQYDREERIRNKIEARRLASLADWNKLIHNYLEAYRLAVEKAYPAEKK